MSQVIESISEGRGKPRSSHQALPCKQRLTPSFHPRTARRTATSPSPPPPARLSAPPPPPWAPPRRMPGHLTHAIRTAFDTTNQPVHSPRPAAPRSQHQHPPRPSIHDLAHRALLTAPAVSQPIPAPPAAIARLSARVSQARRQAPARPLRPRSPFLRMRCNASAATRIELPPARLRRPVRF